MITALFNVLSRHHCRRDIVVRITFVLGNLAARSPQARTSIGQHPDTMTLLPTLLGGYLRDEGVVGKLDAPNGTEDEAALDFGSTGSNEDTALKIIRVFANASIEPETGSLLALNEAIINELLVAVSSNNHVLLLPTLATLNNLSFYPIVNQVEIYNRLRGLILNVDVRISSEAARVCGNLSRRQEVRNCFQEDDFFKCTVHLIHSDVDRDLVSALVGIVINLMSDKRLRPAFKAEKGVQRSIDLLYSCLEEKDWDLGSLVCQALWNYCIDCQQLSEVIETKHIIELEDVLVYLLEAYNETSTSNDTDSSCDNSDYDPDFSGAEFCQVALTLLKRVLDYSPRKVELLLND